MKIKQTPMPYPSEHACRLRDPDSFEPDSFRRIVSGGVALIIGKLKGKTTTTTQAIRYPKDKWTTTEARADCRDKKGILFEPAAGQIQEFTDPLDNDFIKTD